MLELHQDVRDQFTHIHTAIHCAMCGHRCYMHCICCPPPQKRNTLCAALGSIQHALLRIQRGVRHQIEIEHHVPWPGKLARPRWPRIKHPLVGFDFASCEPLHHKRWTRTLSSSYSSLFSVFCIDACVTICFLNFMVSVSTDA